MSYCMDETVDPYEFAGQRVEGDVFVEREQVVEPLLPELGDRQPQHREQDKRTAEV